MTWSGKRWFVWLAEVILLVLLAVDFACLIYAKIDLDLPLEGSEQDSLVFKIKSRLFKFNQASETFNPMHKTVLGKELSEDEASAVDSSMISCGIMLAFLLFMWALSYWVPKFSISVLLPWYLYAVSYGDDTVQKAVILLQNMQLRLPLLAVTGIESHDFDLSNDPLYWWWEVKVTVLYVLSLISINNYLYRSSVNNTNQQDVESGASQAEHDDDPSTAPPVGIRAHLFQAMIVRYASAHPSQVNGNQQQLPTIQQGTHSRIYGFFTQIIRQYMPASGNTRGPAAVNNMQVV
ncbi:hypothetical protein OTU49_008213 [Cherax quadricarinatus]|uniref:Uncharacterized protein n=2 Tax=Cherax quadricarinatus TaxID=27406 RepID=A0AAW0WFB8_CHEQU